MTGVIIKILVTIIQLNQTENNTPVNHVAFLDIN